MRGKNNSYLSLMMIPHRLFFIPETMLFSKSYESVICCFSAILIGSGFSL